MHLDIRITREKDERGMHRSSAELLADTTISEIDGHFDFLGKGATTLMDDVREESCGCRVSCLQARWTARMQELSGLVVVAISDLWLDHPMTFHGLRKLFELAIAEAF